MAGEITLTNLTDSTHGTYKAKVESGGFLKYEFNNNNQWIVTTKSGITYKFGLTPQSRQDSGTKIYKWMLEEVRDINNNFVKYEYTKNAGQIYPARISYTGHGSTEGIFEVLFSRTTFRRYLR